MPELPEVETVKRYLDTTVCGYEIIGVSDCTLPRCEADFSGVRGGVISRVSRYGKYLCFHIAHEDSNIAIVSHLAMTGQWYVKERAVFEPHDHLAIEIRKEDTSLFLFYRDPRKFGRIWVTKYPQNVWKHVGRDPIIDKFDVNYLRSKIRVSAMEVKPWILDQEVVCGIGNIYASEILFAAHIHPQTLVSELKLQDLAEIVKHTVSILNSAIKLGGSTIHSFAGADGASGRAQQLHKVYGKENQACQACGHHIKRQIQVKRATFWCPTCQMSRGTQLSTSLQGRTPCLHSKI